VQQTYVFRILRSDGAVRWLEGSSILVEYKGRPAVQMAYVDITERKEAEEALRESEARYRTLVESTEDAVFQLDPEGHYMFVNNAVERILGRSRDDLVGSHLSDIFPPQHAPVPTQMLENVLATSQPVRVEHPLMIGEECTEYSTELMPVYDPDGDIAFVMGVGRDITERKRAEARMRANQARLQAIFDSAAVGIGLINKEWRYIEVNDTLAEMVGYTAEELYQMTPLDLTHPDDVPMSHIYLQALMRGDKQHYRVEKRFHRKNGSVMWIDLSVAPICDETGKPELILGIFTDVSERKHAETELREANERLTHWVRELEQHNHNVAQLNEMSGFLQGCQTLEEAYPVVAHFAHQLFPNHSGALYLFSPEDRLEAMATWGKAPPDVRELAAQRCKVLRSKRAYISSNVEHPVPCNCELAAAPSSPEHIMCLPLVAHAETLGVLHLRNANASDSIWQERWKRLAMMLSGQLALELANLRLRIRLRDQSIRDALTGMFNRRYLDEMLKTELRRADRYEHPVGVIMLDIDHFKQFNDTYGHDGGDVLLRKVGAFLQSNTRGEDIACRYGGEEFMLVLPGASLEDTQQRAEDIRTEIIALQVHHHGQPLRAITASLGVAAYPMHSTSDEDLIKAADQALYRAKARGRNRVEVAELPAGAGDA
jgi:diguanylate cyclase (GGDEF)-like protein/PAS domain S-box-containing protein